MDVAAFLLLENRALRPVPERSRSLKLLLFPVSLAARTSLLKAAESVAMPAACDVVAD
jgi:hypothetical protein